MKPSDYYKNPGVLDNSKMFFFLREHIPELPGIDDFIDEEQLKDINVYVYLSEKDLLEYKFYLICSIWFKNHPVMIIRNGGRAGKDTIDHFITDKGKYKEMIDYILSFLKQDTEIYSPDEDLEELDSFYQYNCKNIKEKAF